MADFLGGKVRVHQGDCLEVMAGLPEASIDALVTDPPYHLTSIVKRFGADDAAPAKSNGATGVYERSSRGFMGKVWDGGDVAFRPETWALALLALKPGAHLIAFGGTRTYHRLAAAIEDAGFEIRDQIGWAYGSGFPKSHDVSKGIDRAAGAEREIVGQYIAPDGNPRGIDRGIQGGRFAAGQSDYTPEKLVTAPATDAARQWEGWGTALKPAWEPIILARKPLVGTVAENVQAHGTGALNIDGCRIPTAADDDIFAKNPHTHGGFGHANAQVYGAGKGSDYRPQAGRWPANIVHDGSEEVLAAFPDAGGGYGKRGGQRDSEYGFGGTMQEVGYGDQGSAARFFYTAKADANDRIGSKHPTVKPVDLMRWLCRLVTPPGGTILDPFAGTGTTGEAAFYEGFNAILIEREAEYVADIERRMKLVMAGPEERNREMIKAAGRTESAGPLFDETR
jgi:DNA modification methylase